MAEQLGAEEAAAVLSSQRIDKTSVMLLPFPHATAPLEHTHACTHACPEDTFGRQAGRCFAPAAGRHVTDPAGISC